MASKSEIKDAVRDVVREELLGHNDPVTKTERTVGVMIERQRRMERDLDRVLDVVRLLNARTRKLYRKMIEQPAGYPIGDQWRPTDDPVDPGYEADG